MGRLYFRKCDETYTLVAEGIEKENAEYHIHLFTKFINPKYEIFYIRTWEKDALTYYDIGSHNELFIFEPDEEREEFLYGENNKTQQGENR